MTVVDTWDDWKTDPTLDVPPSTATPEIDKELRNIKAQVKAHVAPSFYAKDYAGVLALLTSLGSTRAEVVIDSAIAVTANFAPPENIDIRVQPGGSIAMATTKTFKPYGNIIANSGQQIFSWAGTGAFDFSACPTKDFYLDWFGAEKGITNDIATALTKAHNSSLRGKTLWVTQGTWRIATPVVFDATYGFTLKGTDRATSLIVIDVGGSADGLTVGTSGIIGEGGSAVPVYEYSIEDILFGGAASCCRNGVVVSLNVWGNFFFDATLGAAAYAVVFAGPEHTEAKIGLGCSSATVDAAVTAHGLMANGIRVCSEGSNTFHTGQMNLYVKKNTSATAISGKAVALEGVLDAIDITGDFEIISATAPHTGYAIYATDSKQVHIHDTHGETISDMYFERCSNFKFTRVSFPGSTQEDATTGPQTVTLKSCQGMSIDTCFFGRLVISEDTIGTVIGPLILSEQHGGLQDYSGSSQYIGPVSYYSPNTLTKGLFGENRDNQITNHLLTRYVSTTNPDGWSLYQCTGARDTATVHNSTYSCKMVTSGGAGEMAYALSAAQLNAFRGQNLNFGVWLNLPGSQTFTAAAAYIQASVTVPNRANGTRYEVGQAVKQIAGNQVNMLVCRVAGTTDVSEPAFVATIGLEQTDGTVTWVYVPYLANTTTAQPITTTEADGLWRKYSVQQLIPSNATAASVFIDLNRRAAAAEATMYWAEPSLHIGATPGRGVQPGRNEFPVFIQVGATRIYYDQALIPTDASSPLYTLYARVGDQAWNVGVTATTSPGWICTTAGLNNGGVAVWTAMPPMNAT